MKIAAIQMRSGVDVDANISAADSLIRAAAAQGASFISTPEMTHILQRSSKRLFESITDEANDRGVKHFSALASELKIDLLIGSLAIKTAESRAANRSFLFNSAGKICARYDKIHLFDVTVSAAETWKESNVYDRGNAAASFLLYIVIMRSLELILFLCLPPLRGLRARRIGPLFCGLARLRRVVLLSPPRRAGDMRMGARPMATL